MSNNNLSNDLIGKVIRPRSSSKSSMDTWRINFLGQDCTHGEVIAAWVADNGSIKVAVCAGDGAVAEFYLTELAMGPAR